MSNTFASGAKSIAECDVCGFRYKLKQLKPWIVKTKQTNILACPSCWVPDQPQLQIGMYPLDDPQAVRNPRRDNSYLQSGPTVRNTLGEGSRVTQWGWFPVGGPRLYLADMMPNDLYVTGRVGQVTVTVS